MGSILSAWQVTAGHGKATLDASWSMLRGFLRYKYDHAGVAFAEVNEAYTTQTCSCSKVKTGLKGEQEFIMRQWGCSLCGAEHDRDRNAAINIARLGCEPLGPNWLGSFCLQGRGGITDRRCKEAGPEEAVGSSCAFGPRKCFSFSLPLLLS